MQKLSDPGTVNRNVHNDACFFKGYRSSGAVSKVDGGRPVSDVDAPATFDSFGVGYISACPDPDGAGPKVAILSDTNRDGRNDRCFQSGYQDQGVKGRADVAGDFEFHARMNNDSATGAQRVVWGYDPDMDGTRDTWVKDTIRIDWVSSPRFSSAESGCITRGPASFSSKGRAHFQGILRKIRLLAVNLLSVLPVYRSDGFVDGVVAGRKNDAEKASGGPVSDSTRQTAP